MAQAGKKETKSQHAANPAAMPKPSAAGASNPSGEGKAGLSSHGEENSKNISSMPHNGAVERMVDISKIWAIVKKNWMVLKGDKVRMVPLILMPLLMIVIFGYSTGSLPKHLPTAIVDYDQSSFSHLVVEQLSEQDLYSIEYHVGTQDEGKRLLDEGKIKILYILPQGLGEDVASGRPAQIELMADEADSSVAQIAKSSAQQFASQLSRAATERRLDAISARAALASGSISASRNAMAAIASQDSGTIIAASAATSREAAGISKKSSDSLEDSITALQNSLGYMVDQNEVVDSFNPASMGRAALVELSTGDSQQSTLQQIALYRGMLGAQYYLSLDIARMAAGTQSIASQAKSAQSGAKAAISLQDSAGRQLALISSDAQTVTAPISIAILEPYGYGRRGIDFLLPSILALIIFQGASMGLGRAIAGERKDGSLTRVFLTPTSNVTIILGTQIFYLLLETIRSSLIIFVAMALFGVTISGHIPDIIFIIGLFSLGATGIGMVMSVITKTQEQYMALGMLISMPMMFLSGAFFPIQTMPAPLQSLATVLPVTYAADALRGVMVKGFTLYQVIPDLAALAAFGAFTVTLSLLLFKRELV